MNRKMICSIATSKTSSHAVHLTTLAGDAPACGTEMGEWNEAPESWTFELEGQTFTYPTTVDCKKCRKFVR